MSEQTIGIILMIIGAGLMLLIFCHIQVQQRLEKQIKEWLRETRNLNDWSYKIQRQWKQDEMEK